MRKVALVLATAVLVAISAAPAGAGSIGRFVTVEKRVVGPGPAGPYDFETLCAGGLSSFSLDDGQSFTNTANSQAAGTTCTVTETGTQGATPSFSCTATGGASCSEDNRTVTWSGDLEGEATIVVTNTFQEPTTTTTPGSTSSTSTTSTTVVAPRVSGQPTFTG